MAKRHNGDGTWGTKTIKGKEYKFYRDKNGHYFYGATEAEINEKRRKYVPKEKPKIQSNMTLYECMEHAIDEKKLSLSPSTYCRQKDLIKAMMSKTKLGKTAITGVKKHAIQSYINSLTEKYSRATIVRIAKLIKLGITSAINEDILVDNPYVNIIMPSEDNVKKKKREVPFIIKDDLDKLYTECKRKNTREFRINGEVGTPVYGVNAKIIVLIAHTGMRVSEVKGLTWENVDFENKKIYIRQAVVDAKDDKGKPITKTKGPKSKSSNRTIPLSDTALEMLHWLEDQNPKHSKKDSVCGKTIPNTSNLQRTLDCMLVRAGCSISHCGLHGLRHGFGSILLTEGVDIKIISKLLGHAKISTTYDIYIDFTENQVSNELINVLNKKDDYSDLF